MRIMDKLDQKSPEWLLWRQGGLGASDAASVMGLSPWKSRSELLDSKLVSNGTGSKKYKRPTNDTPLPGFNAAMARGNRLEPFVREIYERVTKIKMPPVCVIHDEYDWMLASLDGLSEDRQIVLEIKCPNMKVHQEALDGQVAGYYWPQVQHQLIVTGCPVLHYVSYSEARKFSKSQQFAPVKVLPDPAYMAELLEEEIKFWKEVERLRRE